MNNNQNTQTLTSGNIELAINELIEFVNSNNFSKSFYNPPKNEEERDFENDLKYVLGDDWKITIQTVFPEQFTQRLQDKHSRVRQQIEEGIKLSAQGKETEGGLYGRLACLQLLRELGDSVLNNPGLVKSMNGWILRIGSKLI